MFAINFQVINKSVAVVHVQIDFKVDNLIAFTQRKSNLLQVQSFSCFPCPAGTPFPSGQAVQDGLAFPSELH